MNKFFIVFALTALPTSICNAQDSTTFKCVSPVDVVKGVGCYILDTGERVVEGVGDIIKAPFKSKMCVPKEKMYGYEATLFRLPRITPVPEKNAVPVPLYKKPTKGTPAKERLYYPLYRQRIADGKTIA